MEVATINLVEFWEWMNQKYIEWRGDSRATISDFAKHIGVRQQVMSSWMQKDGKLPRAEGLTKISAKFGFEVYDVLGLPNPLGQLPPGLRSKVEAALMEINSIYASRHIAADSPEAEQIANEVFEKMGFIRKDS